jgi:Domain of unknown function (DUF6362)
VHSHRKGVTLRHTPSGESAPTLSRVVCSQTPNANSTELVGSYGCLPCTPETDSRPREKCGLRDSKSVAQLNPLGERAQSAKVTPGSALLPASAAIAPVWICPTCGTGLDDACDTLAPAYRIDCELVIFRLVEAGRTLLSMRGKSPFPAGYSSAWPDIVRQAIESYGYNDEQIGPAVPSSAAIDRMDAMWRWLGLVPDRQTLVRRVVAARAFVHPVTGRHVVNWRRLADQLRTDYRSMQRWQRNGAPAAGAA